MTLTSVSSHREGRKQIVENNPSECGLSAERPVIPEWISCFGEKEEHQRGSQRLICISQQRWTFSRTICNLYSRTSLAPQGKWLSSSIQVLSDSKADFMHGISATTTLSWRKNYKQSQSFVFPETHLAPCCFSLTRRRTGAAPQMLFCLLLNREYNTVFSADLMYFQASFALLLSRTRKQSKYTRRRSAFQWMQMCMKIAWNKWSTLSNKAQGLCLEFFVWDATTLLWQACRLHTQPGDMRHFPLSHFSAIFHSLDGRYFASQASFTGRLHRNGGMGFPWNKDWSTSGDGGRP